jgi:hypothetical protein
MTSSYSGKGKGEVAKVVAMEAGMEMGAGVGMVLQVLVLAKGLVSPLPRSHLFRVVLTRV